MNQSTQPIDTEQSTLEPQELVSEQIETIDVDPTNEAQVAEMPQSSAEQKSFAHDINFKIDQLEANIDDLAKQYRQSEGNFKLAIGDISSRTTVVTQEIAQINEQLLKDAEQNKELVEDLDGRLKRSLRVLNEELMGVDSQIAVHQATIQSIHAELEESRSNIDALQQGFNEKIDELASEQDKQSKTQQVFAEGLDNLEVSTNKIADDLYTTKVDQATQQRLNKKNFMIATGVLASMILVAYGVITYLHWNQSDFTPEIVSSEIDSKLQNLESSLNDRMAAKSEIASTEAALSSKITALQTKVSDTSTNLSIKNQATTESLQALADKVASLQLSVYGPEDNTATQVIPAIPVKGAQWIAERNPEHYAIQLVGVYRERSMMNFVNQYKQDLQEYPIAFNVSKYRGQNWYNVIYGNFATFSEAQVALNNLSNRLQNNSPWVRQMGSIQRTAVSQ
ncbi:MAG: SPOR domain-containing protein [Pseudomonadales bacterium]|nr:SPOR domain-containing protein [Pseudomonadales bacterium]